MARQKDVSTEMWRGISFLVVGIIMVVFYARDLFNSFIEPNYLYELSIDDIKDGAYVQEDIYAALDYFMYEETTRTKYGVEMSSNVTSYFYIVPVLTADVEQELYMAVEVGSAAEKAMNSICDDTYEYLIGEMEEYQFGYNTYHVTGSIRNMKSEELQYMVEWFQSTEYFGTTNAEEIKQYILPVVLKKYNGTMARVMVVIGGILTLVGFLMVRHCSDVRRRQKKEEEYRAAHRNAYESRYPQPNIYQSNGSYPQGNAYQPNSVYSQPNNMYQPNSVYSQPNNMYQPEGAQQPVGVQQQNYSQNVYTPGSNLQPDNNYIQNLDEYLYNSTYDNKE